MLARYGLEPSPREKLHVSALVAFLLVTLSLLGCPSDQMMDSSDGSDGEPTADTPAVEEPPFEEPAVDELAPSMGSSCQVDKGCHEPAPIQNCEADAAPGQPEATAASLESKIGQRVVLVGTLLGHLSCTEKACDEFLPCCNSCFGSMSVEFSAPEGQLRWVLLLDTADPNRFAVEGDESLACPPYVANVTVRAVGTLGRDGHEEFTLLDPVLCLPS